MDWNRLSELLKTGRPYWIPFAVILGALMLILIVYLYYRHSVKKRRQQRIEKRREERRRILNNFVFYKEFEHQWITGRGRGLKYEDGPGCYVILFFDEPVTDQNYEHYKNVYVGQSVNRYQRVHNHFNGKGNGDVYADIKYGKFVYVKFFPCYDVEMNRLEQSLIHKLNATKSYNNTRGGSQQR